MKKISVLAILVFFVVPVLYAQQNSSMTACFPNGYYWDGLHSLFTDYMKSDELASMRVEEHLTYYLMGMNHSMMFFVPQIGEDIIKSMIADPDEDKKEAEDIVSDAIRGKTYLISPASSFDYADLIEKIRVYYRQDANKIIPTAVIAVLARDSLEADLDEEEVEKILGRFRENAKDLQEQWDAVSKGR